MVSWMRSSTDDPSSSSIEKLKILGVRNFGIRQSESIFFEAPLTLIVGYNGSGKTTIIECLKYATTGTLPPNSKNGAFVHDPKLAAEKEVMAQVKLQFRSNTGNRMVVTRSLQVQLKKGGLPTMKTLECQLMTVINGERTSMSKRVAELDNLIPLHLGVPTAILESVIFCHQDESLWPMSEPSILKKKFDSIFEAEKYTKAVDNLKAMRKAKVTQNTLFKQAEDHARTVKDKAERVKKQLTDLHQKIEEHRDKAARLKQAMEAAKSLSEEKVSQSHEVFGYVNKLRNKKERVQYLQESLDRLQANLVEFKESDEWLTATLNQYNEKMAQYEEQSRQYTDQYLELQQNIKNLRQEAAQKQAERGRHLAAKDSYENSIKSRVDLVRDAARIHSMRGYEDDIDEDHVQDFVDRVNKLFQEKDRELDRVKKLAEDERNKFRGELNDLSIRRSTSTQEKVNARQTISASERKIELQDIEANRIKMDEGTKASRDASLLEAENRVSQLLSEFEASNWESTLKAERHNLMELEAEQQRLHEEFLQSSHLAENRAQLDVNKKNAQRLRGDLEIQKSTYNEQFRLLIGSDWTVGNLETAYQEELDRTSTIVAETKKLQQGLSEELSTINLKLKTQRATLAKKNEDKDRCEAAILESIVNPDTGRPITSVDEYPTELDALKKDHDEFMKEFDGKNYISDYYRKAGDVVNKHNLCRLCERPFNSQNERSSALEKINKLIHKYATEAAEQERQHLVASWKKAHEAKFQYDMYLVLKNSDIPSLEKDIKKLDGERSPLLKRLESQDLEVGKTELAKRELEAQRNNVNNIVTLANQIANIDEEVARLSSSGSISAATLSTEEIREQSDACKNRLTILRAKVSKLEQDRDAAQKSLEGARNDVGFHRDKAIKAKYELDRKLGILSTIAELRGNILQQREIDSKADAELEGLVPLVKKVESQLEDATKRGRLREKEVQTEKDRLKETVNKFQLVNRAIDAYVESGGPTKLAACERSLKNLDLELKTMEAEQTEITKKNNELQKMIDDSDKTKRHMEDNLSCRQFRRELEVERAQISDLASQNFQEKFDQLDREATEANEHFQKLTAERSVIVGAMSTMDDQFNNLQQEWDTEYQDAAVVFREAHVNVITNTAACEDLAKFTKALDEAIMKFHTLKMQEINAVAGELWRNTYQGTDVDTIMIKSESENTANKRAINYRLVMIKQDAEMDMRGRCSAGQRVLACIIIRLALAECFGVNCGVIALDEPTTNLDSDNIKALAISLNQLIHHRRRQKNFQLIIITHDEEFLKHMRCTDFTDNYYRVYRDVDQKSAIRRQKIGDLTQ